ncbi:MAG: hypothetical protein AAFQ59_19440 [Pseudomonadota bacterium]
MDIPVELLQATCPVEIVGEVRALKSRTPDFTDRLQALIQTSIYVETGQPLAPDCYALAIGFILDGSKQFDPTQRVSLLSAIRSVAPSERSAINAQVSRFLLGPHADTLPASQRFAALWDYRIDARETLRDAYSAAPVGDPQSDTFAFALYAARFGDADAVNDLTSALETAQSDPHAVNGMLTVILQARPAALWGAVLKYSEDNRRGVGVDGPGTGPSPAELLAPWQDQSRWQ